MACRKTAGMNATTRLGPGPVVTLPGYANNAAGLSVNDTRSCPRRSRGFTTSSRRKVTPAVHRIVGTTAPRVAQVVRIKCSRFADQHGPLKGYEELIEKRKLTALIRAALILCCCVGLWRICKGFASNGWYSGVADTLSMPMLALFNGGTSRSSNSISRHHANLKMMDRPPFLSDKG